MNNFLNTFSVLFTTTNKSLNYSNRKPKFSLKLTQYWHKMLSKPISVMFLFDAHVTHKKSNICRLLLLVSVFISSRRRSNNICFVCVNVTVFNAIRFRWNQNSTFYIVRILWYILGWNLKRILNFLSRYVHIFIDKARSQTLPLES